MSQALENCSWLRTVVIVCVVFASIRMGSTQQITGVGASATIEPVKFPANGSVVLRVHIHPAKPLATGAIITTQLPNAMLAEELSYSLTKKIALAKGGFDWDNVMVQATGNPDAKFDVKIETHEPEDQNLPSRHGQRVSATLTSPSLPADTDIVFTYRTSSPWIASKHFPVNVSIDGKRIQPDPSFSVVSGPIAYSRVIIPSSAKPGQPFRVLLVSLDQFDNLADSPKSNVQILLDDKVLRKDISYTGRYETTVSLPAQGVYRLRADGVESNPIRITNDAGGPYWGDMHSHNEWSSDAVSSNQDPDHYTYARDISGLDFAALSNHANGLEPIYWTQAQALCRKYNDPGHFVSILGYEAGFGYHLNGYYYSCDEGPADGQRADVGRGKPEDYEAFRKYLEHTKMLLELHHMGISWGLEHGSTNFDGSDKFPAQTRLMEIYSAHGESEYYNPKDALSYEHNLSAPFSNSLPGPHYARDAWAQGNKFVTIASSDDHNGQPGKRFNGLAAVTAPSLDRTAILNSIAAGHVYGTTGERILLDFSLNGKPMGSVLKTKAGEPLNLKVEVHGTGPLEVIEVFRYSFQGNGMGETAYVRRDIGSEDFIGSWTESSQGRSLYYVRVQQRDSLPVMVPTSQMRPVRAWSTPIWLEAENTSGN
jgi:hypothetical protein